MHKNKTRKIGSGLQVTKFVLYLNSDLGGVSVEGDVITFAKSVKTGITIITTHNTTTGLPNDTYQYSSGVILRRTDVIQVMLCSYDNNVAINTCRNNVWSGWDIITKNSDFRLENACKKFVAGYDPVTEAAYIQFHLGNKTYQLAMDHTKMTYGKTENGKWTTLWTK